MTTSKGNYDINIAPKSLSHHIVSRHSSDNISTLVLTDSQGKFFDNLLRVPHPDLFNTGDNKEDLFPKYRDVIHHLNLL